LALGVLQLRKPGYKRDIKTVNNFQIARLCMSWAG
jgi:hypothetical protein